MKPSRVGLPKSGEGAVKGKVIFSTIKHSKDGRAWVSCSNGMVYSGKGSLSHHKIHNKAVYCVNVIEH